MKLYSYLKIGSLEVGRDEEDEVHELLASVIQAPFYSREFQLWNLNNEIKKRGQGATSCRLTKWLILELTDTPPK